MVSACCAFTNSRNGLFWRARIFLRVSPRVGGILNNHLSAPRLSAALTVLLFLVATRADVLYVSDYSNFAGNANTGFISEVSASGSIVTFASGLNTPEGLVFDRSGNLYLALQHSDYTRVGLGLRYRTVPSGSTFLAAAGKLG